MVQEWDPATAPEAELAAVVDLLNAAGAVDVPDDPRWRIEGYREYLWCTMPGERRITWIAEDDRVPEGEGQIYAHVNILLLGDIGVPRPRAPEGAAAAGGAEAYGVAVGTGEATAR